MVMSKERFEDLLKTIDNLSEEQKRILQGRLNATEQDDTLEASGVVGQSANRIAGLGAASEDRLRQYRLKLYARARQHWQSVGDTARLALTDADLDEQFWLFDGEGIPRLKEDEGKIEVPETSMMRLLKLAEESPIDFADSFSHVDPDLIIENEFGDYLWKRMQNEHGTEEDTH